MLFRGKRKSNGAGGWFFLFCFVLFYLLIKQCVHVYMHVIFVLTTKFFLCLFVVRNFYVLESNNGVCKFDKNKYKNLLKKVHFTDFFLRVSTN